MTVPPARSRRGWSLGAGRGCVGPGLTSAPAPPPPVPRHSRAFLHTLLHSDNTAALHHLTIHNIAYQVGLQLGGARPGGWGHRLLAAGCWLTCLPPCSHPAAAADERRASQHCGETLSCLREGLHEHHVWGPHPLSHLGHWSPGLCGDHAGLTLLGGREGKRGWNILKDFFFLNYNSVCLCLLGEVAYLGPLSGLSVTGARQLKKRCTRWELRVNLSLGQNEDCSPRDSLR